MSDKLPQISGERMTRVLVKLGFKLKHQTGSHMKFVKTERGVSTILIVYQHHTLKKGSLSRMLNRLHLSTKEFKELL